MAASKQSRLEYAGKENDMEKVLNKVTNCYGDEIPSAVLYQEGGQFYLWEINCFSALHHNLGNCHCVNHPASIDDPVSTNEVIQRFGSDALDGFDEPSEAQIIFDAFGIEINELETYLKVSYRIGANPLPALRKRTEIPVVFGEEPDLLIFPEEKPGTKVFIVNSHGEISVVTVEGRQEAANIPLENIPAGIGRKK